jgi:hypothetical protein
VSEFHTEHINTVCGQNVELTLNLMVHEETNGIQKVKSMSNGVELLMSK